MRYDSTHIFNKLRIDEIYNIISNEHYNNFCFFDDAITRYDLYNNFHYILLCCNSNVKRIILSVLILCNK